MLKKTKILTEISKNRYLLISCLMLSAGVLIGCYSVKIFPLMLKEKLFSIASFEAEDFLYSFADNFVFPFIALSALFLSGFSAAGHLTVSLEAILSGTYIGIKSSILLLNTNEIYLKFFVLYLIFVCFMAVILAESAFFTSSAILSSLKSSNAANMSYQAKYLSVKYIAFTLFSAVISLIFRLS